MQNLGKVLVLVGGVLVVIGVVFWALGRLGFRGLPGDIRYESDNVRFYFPIATSVLISLLLTLALWLWHWLHRR